jgi:hypothetical protein
VPVPSLKINAAIKTNDPIKVIPHFVSTPFSTSKLNIRGGSLLIERKLLDKRLIFVNASRWVTYHPKIMEQYTLKPEISASCPRGSIQEKNRFSVG